MYFIYIHLCCPFLYGCNGEFSVTSCHSTYLTLQDISAVTSGYSLINMYLFQFECKKGYKRNVQFD